VATAASEPRSFPAATKTAVPRSEPAGAIAGRSAGSVTTWTPAGSVGLPTASTSVQPRRPISPAAAAPAEAGAAPALAEPDTEALATGSVCGAAISSGTPSRSAVDAALATDARSDDATTAAGADSNSAALTATETDSGLESGITAAPGGWVRNCTGTGCGELATASDGLALERTADAGAERAPGRGRSVHAPAEKASPRTSIGNPSRRMIFVLRVDRRPPIVSSRHIRPSMG
jgi:hypothetical protein